MSDADHESATGVDSLSMGDETMHPSFEALVAAFAARAPTPREDGRIALIVRRADGGRRESLERVDVSIEHGVPGDAWGRRVPLNPEAQITVMQHDVAALVANGQPLVLFGDNLFVDLDLSNENLPIGSRLRAGTALLEVTPKPHNGCAKFRARFGADALRFVARPETRHLNLRGIHVRVIEAGTLTRADVIEVVSRPG